MSDQPLDLRRSLHILRRHKAIISVVMVLGILAGGAFALLKPPMLTSTALVVLPASAARLSATQAVIAGSDPVLSAAEGHIASPVSLATLRKRVQAKSLTPNVLSISAQGGTAAQAVETANAVADSYVAYVGSPGSPDGQVMARVLEPATDATGTPLPVQLLITGGVGVLLGLLVGAIIALAIGRGDRRLRERDEIADSIGVPVLASIPVAHPSDAAGWTKLLDGYTPGAVHAWTLRKALQHLVMADIRGGAGASLVILSLSSDRAALALAPQISVFAASLEISTALVVGPQQDASATATLRAACAIPPPPGSRRSSRLRVSVRDRESADRLPRAALSVVVATVDGDAPRVADTMRAAVTVLGVSAGAATADQLARIAASAAADGRHISGILVADPDPADNTTGRLPQLARPGQRRMPTRLTGTARETKR